MESTTEDSEKIEVIEPVKIFDKKLKSIICSRIPREYMYEEKVKEIFSEWVSSLCLHPIVLQF